LGGSDSEPVIESTQPVDIDADVFSYYRQAAIKKHCAKRSAFIGLTGDSQQLRVT